MVQEISLAEPKNDETIRSSISMLFKVKSRKNKKILYLLNIGKGREDYAQFELFLIFP